MALETSVVLTHTPLTRDKDVSPLRQIVVSTLINAAIGALLGRHVLKQTYQQGALLGAIVTLAKGTIGAFSHDYILRHNKYLYGNAIGFFGATFGLTYLKQANLPNFRMNVIYAAAIQVLTKMITQAIADHSGLKI